jgi:chloramphenicol-sensitive protein RarD
LSKGIALSVSASVLFAVMYYYTSLLTPLSGVEIFGWRMLLTVPCMTVFMLVSGEWRRVLELLRRVAGSPKLIGGLIVSAALLGVQLWLFMWAPLNGYSLDVSLGYFLLPLAMVLTGRIVYGDSLSYLQKIAVFLPARRGNELYRVGGFSWATLVVWSVTRCTSCCANAETDNLGGLWVDMTLMLPGGVLVCTRWRARLCRVRSIPRPVVADSAARPDQCLGAGGVHHCQPLVAVQPVWSAQLCRAGIAARCRAVAR